jgi:tetratricopeptide (TPR) repeat protein
MKNQLYFISKTAACIAISAIMLFGCVPSVEMPGVLSPINDPKWKKCADDLAARQEQAMLDDLMLDTNRLTCQGVVLAADGKTDKSLQLLAEAGVKDPKDSRPHYLAGRILADAGRYDEALTEFERSHERDPSLEIPTARLGRTLKETKGAEEATSFLRRAVDRKLCPYSCMQFLAETYHEIDKNVFAKPIYEQMAAEAPWEPGAFVGLASLANADKDFDKEISYLQKATEAKNFKELSDKQKASIFFSLAFAKYNKKEYEGAKAIIDLATRLDPNRADWHLLAGWIELKGDKAAQALISFDKAKAIDPNYAAIYEGIGDAELALSNIQGARSAYSRARQIDPSNALVTLKTAHAAALADDFQIAEKLFEDATSAAGATGLPKDLVEKVSKLIAKHKKNAETPTDAQ